MDAAPDRRGDRHRREGDPPGGRVVGHGEDQLPDARPRHRAPQPRRAERARRDQHRARVRADRPAELRLRDDHRPGQRPGRPRARPEVRPAARRPRHREPRAPRHVAGVWGIDPSRAAARRASTAYEIFRKIDRGEIKGLLVRLLQPGRLAAGQRLRQADAREAGVLRRHRFLPERDGPATPTSSCPARCTRRTRAPSARPKGGSSRSTRPSTCPGDARQDWRIIQDIAQALGRERGFTFASPREIFEELRVASKGGVADYSGITYEKIERQMRRLLAVPGYDRRQPDDHPGTPRLFEPGSWNPVAKGAGPFYFPDGKARFNVDRLRAADRGRGRRLPGHPDDRAGWSAVPVRQPDAAHRPAGGSVPGAAHGDAPAAGAASCGIADGDWVTVESRRGSLHAAVPGRDDDPPGHGVRPVPLGRGARASTR